MGSLNIFIRVPSYPNINLYILTLPFLTMTQHTHKQKAGNSKKTNIKKNSKRVITCEMLFGSNSNNCEPLQYVDLVL